MGLHSVADKVRLLRLNPRQKVTWNCRLLHVTCRYVYNLFSGVGITGGVHRLWAHRSYKATFPLRVYLMLSNSIANQGDLSIPHHTIQGRRSLVTLYIREGIAHTIIY